jgi:Regulator of chromosome condensation (RCC1) repeat/Alpha/beta hydrolase of unknown function (DUF900)
LDETSLACHSKCARYRARGPCLVIRASAPSWWSTRGVLVQDTIPDDYAPANQGQVKNIARAAAEEMEARLSGGAGNDIRALINSWSVPGPENNDFAPINVGQLKNVTKPFYDRLISLGVVDTYPWLKSLAPTDDFAAANIGQVKELFSFEIPSANSLSDPRTDRLAAGPFSASLALQENATWIWNDHLSDGSEFDRGYPRRLLGLPGIRSVSAGERYLVALANDGGVWTWGDNAVGQLGDGTTTGRNTPAAVPNLAGIVSVKAGGSHVLALSADGTLITWGDNRYGQLGTGDTTPSSTFTAIPDLDNVRAIATSYAKSAALRMDGTVWTWGYERYDGQDIFHTSPVAVPDLLDVIDIVAGYEHMVAVKSDGTVLAWGSNYANQIANGNPWWKYQDVPFQVPNLPPIVKVASSYDHTLAIANNSTVWAWGYNFNGQLGDGTSDQRQTPVQVVGLTDVTAIATASTYSLAMKSDGTVWAWGDGAAGMLPGTDRHVPQLVGLGLLDTNHNGMDDRWEIYYLGSLDQSGDGDLDGDGISNRLEYLRGTNPNDYYNGATPTIEIAGGNNQVGDPGTFLKQPFKVRVRSNAGQLLVNAPVSFSIESGSGALAISPGEVQQETVSVRTDTNGEAAVYHVLPAMAGVSTHTIVSAGSGTAVAAAAFRGVTRFVAPPQPTPTPDPNATPTPTPDPSATPTATPIGPYRYAIIDLGKDMYPSRINNKGWIVVQGPDAKDNWGYFRWKSGTLEPLLPNNPDIGFTIVDMNDDGIAVGWEERANLYALWADNAVNEFGAALAWAPEATHPTRLSGPIEPSWNKFLPGSIQQAFFSAIANRNADTHQTAYYGSAYFGEGGYRWLHLFDYHQVLNAQRWMDAAGSPTPLSFSKSSVTYQAFPVFDWNGPMDRVTRANSAGHYIGSRITPNNVNPPGNQGGMIDGKAATFDPVDLSEAGIVVGSKGSVMIIRGSDGKELSFPDSYPIALSDHTRPAPSPSASSSPTATPQPTPSPAPQVLSWTGPALVLWELQQDGKTWHSFGLEEMIPSMDGWDSLAPYDMNDNGLIVGTAWHTDPSKPSAPGEQHGFLLVPCELKVDGNRDGKLDSGDTGAITEDNPLRFWINDDDDALDTSGTDVPGSLPHNYTTLITSAKNEETGQVDGIRDLVDFLPIHLNIEQLLNLYPVEGASAFLFKLKHASGSVNFVYTDLTVENAFDYLHKLDGNQLDNATTIGGNEPTNGAVTIHVTKQGVPLEASWLKRARDTRKAVILIEGHSATEDPLVLEIDDPHGKKVTNVRLPLKLSPVEEMYRHINLMSIGNAAGGRATELGVPKNYPDDLCGNKNFVFVHGFNVTPDAARGWNAEMFKRLYQSGSKAKFYGITWDGAETNGTLVPDYHKNVDNAFAAAQAFAQFVNGLNGDVTVSAHSLGNMLVGSAIHDWGAKIKNYLMIDAAVALESYDSTAEKEPEMVQPAWNDYLPHFWASEWYNCSAFSAEDGRRTLTWRNRFSSIGPNTYNFYSASEDVLRKQEGNPSTWDDLILAQISDHGIYAWAFQEKLKGLQRIVGLGPISVQVGSTYGGWQFTHNYFFDPVHVGTPSAALSQTFSDQSLMTEPIFDPGFSLGGTPPIKEARVLHRGAPSWIADLTDESRGSVTAELHRNQLLAEMFPATTLPAGANPITKLESANVNMPELFITDRSSWPNKRTFADVPEWRHSDIKQIAYSHLYQVFIKWKTIGALDQ